MFKYLKLKIENNKLHDKLEAHQRMIDLQSAEISRLNDKIIFLFHEISRRDQKIIEQQKRMRFFGIQIDNEEYEAEKLDYPATIKL